MPNPGDESLYIGLEHLDSGSLKVSRWGSDVPITGEKLVMKKGDILFGRRNTYLRRAAIAPHDGLFSAHGMVFRPNLNLMNPTFFPFFIASDYFMDAAIRISVGSLSPTVNWKTLKDLEFNIPELFEQEKYGEILFASNELKEAYTILLQRTDDIVKSQFVETFGAEKEYSRMTLAKVCTKITDGTHKTPDYQESGIAFISAKNIIDGKLSFDDIKHITEKEYDEIQKRCRTEKGDVLMAKSGSLGTVAIVETDDPIGLFESLAVLKYDRTILDGVFLHSQLQSESVQQQLMSGVKGVAVKHLHLNVISQIRIIVPPIEEQRTFAEFVIQTDKSKLAIRKAIESLERCQKAIMNQIFG